MYATTSKHPGSAVLYAQKVTELTAKSCMVFADLSKRADLAGASGSPTKNFLRECFKITAKFVSYSPAIPTVRLRICYSHTLAGRQSWPLAASVALCDLL